MHSMSSSIFIAGAATFSSVFAWSLFELVLRVGRVIHPGFRHRIRRSGGGLCPRGQRPLSNVTSTATFCANADREIAHELDNVAELHSKRRRHVACEAVPPLGVQQTAQ